MVEVVYKALIYKILLARYNTYYFIKGSHFKVTAPFNFIYILTL